MESWKRVRKEKEREYTPPSELVGERNCFCLSSNRESGGNGGNGVTSFFYGLSKALSFVFVTRGGRPIKRNRNEYSIL